MVKIPYGISNFKQFVSNGYYYVDRLKAYLQADEYLQTLTELKAYVVVFTGNEGWVKEVVVG